MRKFRGNARQFGGSFSAGAVYANTVNITHVTNATHVTKVLRQDCSNGGRAQYTRPKRWSGKRAERPSELLDYIVQGRSSGEICGESVRTLGIAARQFGSGVEGVAHGVGRMATGILEGTVEVITALFGKSTC